MFISRHQSAGHHQNLLIAYKSFENVAEFRYLAMTLMNQNFFTEKVRAN